MAEKNQKLEQGVEEYYSSSKTDEAYKTCWGEGNIHFGFYPHLMEGGEGKEVLPLPEAAAQLTSKMIEEGGITSESKVVDFGCGYGLPAIQIAKETGATVVGLDLSTLHIRKCNELLAEENKKRKEEGKGDLPVKFVEGSFTALPEEIKKEAPFTHMFSQVAIAHVHQDLETIFKEAYSVLGEGGKLVVSDYLGAEGQEATEETKEKVWKRLKFSFLYGHSDWKQKVTGANFKIDSYLDLDAHMALSYEELARAALKGGFKTADGLSLGENYEASAAAASNKQIGMNLCIASK